MFIPSIPGLRTQHSPSVVGLKQFPLLSQPEVGYKRVDGFLIPSQVREYELHERVD
jgi:hypothetical protein